MWTVLAIIIILIILFIFLSPAAEYFNQNFFQSILEKDMDYMKDSKGKTVNDTILYNHMVNGAGIDSPF
jgi:hypothetical protein